MPTGPIVRWRLWATVAVPVSQLPFHWMSINDGIYDGWLDHDVA